MAFIDQPIRTILQAHSTQIALLGGMAELGLQYFVGSGLPWYLIAGLFGLVLVGRVIKQPSISGAESPDAG